jgi:hypothetical protein
MHLAGLTLALVTVTAGAVVLRGALFDRAPGVAPATPASAPGVYVAPASSPSLASAAPSLDAIADEQVDEVAAALDELFAALAEESDGAARSISGHVRSVDGELLPGATVVATHEGSAMAQTAITDEHGGFEITDLDVHDDWVVTVYYADYTEEHPGVRTFHERTSRLELYVDEYATFSRSIVGRVREEEEGPWAHGATIVVSRAGGPEPPWVHTDDDGWFAIREIPAGGDWALTVYLADLEAHRTITVSDDRPTEIDVVLESGPIVICP